MDTSAIDFDFGPSRSIRIAVHGPKMEYNDLVCASVCK